MTDDPAQERITAFWSAIAAYYEAHEGNVPALASPEYAAWVEATEALLPRPPADVLDIGTGTGFLALIAAKLGHRVTGIDLSESMLAEARAGARRRGLTVRFERRDAVSPGFAPASFDAILSRHFLWTLREPEGAFRHWRELVRPGGRVVAIDGHWFAAEQPAEADGTFEQYYSRETRAALPLMTAADLAPVIATFERAGWSGIEVSHLGAVHSLAEHPPGPQPWYVVVARA